jgi:hypothetical protein
MKDRIKSLSCRGRLPWFALPLAALAIFASALPARASAEDAPPKPADAKSAAKQPAAPEPAPDVLVFTNGDQITGKFLRVVAGTVNFHSDMLGDISVTWDKVRELRSSQKFVVLEGRPGVSRKKAVAAAAGEIHVADQKVDVEPANPAQPPQSTPAARSAEAAAAPVATVPIKNAQFVLDETTYQKQLREEPNFFTGWDGTLTAGVTIVQATDPQYTYTSAVALARTVPTVTWLQTRNRTTADFSSSFGEITSPAYTSGGVTTPETITKSSIFHADAERDQYLAPRVYALAQTAFDHNYAQGLDLQQIYGGGVGWTVIKKPKQQLDIKGTLQYEKQQFISSASGTNENLIGSTFATTYVLKLPKGIVFNQQISYIPAYNVTRAYSANETDSLVFPLYKKLSFNISTIDSYLNDPPPAEPPTRLNSFQFTTGITYTLKSNY